MRYLRLPLLLLAIFLLVACQSTAADPAPAATPAPGSRTVGIVGEDGSLVAGTDGLDWWNDTVFYEIFVRSFRDSDGDGIGDLQGVIEKLDYLNDGDPATDDDLGVTGIWLMPIMDATSYHGYDVIDYYRVDPDYGTNEDFQALIEAAHARGIRVIVDLVLNHTGREHPWFLESRDPASDRRDWYIWAAEDPGYAGPNGQQVWYGTPNGFYYAVFWSGMPDLNYANPDVTAEMHDATRFWLENMGADGFRLDAIKHLVENGAQQENTAATYDWFADYYTFYKGINPEAFTIGEAWSATSFVTRYVGDKVDTAFEFDLAVALMTSASTGLNVAASKAIAGVVDAYPAGQYGTFLSNHDQNRVMSQLDGDGGAAKIAASMLLTLPGIPFIYYGEEIGMEGVKPDEQIRRPMQWTAEANKGGFSEAIPWQLLDGNHRTVNVALQEADPASLLNHYRALIDLRNAHEALRVGDVRLVEADNLRLLAYLRQSDDENLLVLINLSAREISAADYALALPEAGPGRGLQRLAAAGQYRRDCASGDQRCRRFRFVPATGCGAPLQHLCHSATAELSRSSMEEGIQFPRDADGRRATTAVNKAIYAAALADVDPPAAAAAAAEVAWRSAYPRHLRALTVAGLADADHAVASGPRRTGGGLGADGICARRGRAGAGGCAAAAADGRAAHGSGPRHRPGGHCPAGGALSGPASTGGRAAQAAKALGTGRRHRGQPFPRCAPRSRAPRMAGPVRPDAGAARRRLGGRPAGQPGRLARQRRGR